MLRVEIKHAAQFADVTRRLRGAKGNIRRDTTQGLKKAGAKTLAKVQHNWETLRMRGFRAPNRRPARGVRPAPMKRFRDRMPGTRIRRRISRVTEFRVSTSAGSAELSFKVHAGRLGSARRLPGYFDRGVRFRHPVMGARSRWAGQQASPPGAFRETVLRDLPEMRGEVDRQLDRTRRALDGRR